MILQFCNILLLETINFIRITKTTSAKKDAIEDISFENWFCHVLNYANTSKTAVRHKFSIGRTPGNENQLEEITVLML